MTKLTDQQTKDIVADIAEIKEALLGNPYDENNKGLVKQVGENTKEIKSINKGRLRNILAAGGLGVASGGLGASKGAVLLAKAAALLGF